ncbi:MAG TPA: arginine--tRNA ligase [Syntrophorhabdaceae bacterium]|nr:arginine--tRNA ligase [Syntrophorhabdaceae bacterium]HQM81089.1 arginine--tRNA ligase [Syntrophorhabdaceae bacterium]
MIRKTIAAIIKDAYEGCKKDGTLPVDTEINPVIEIPREEGHGDYSTNIAFLLAPILKKNPTAVAEDLMERMAFDAVCDRIEVAGKGFINFYVKDAVWQELLQAVCANGIDALFPATGKGKRVLIEFVSANPTGPLHIGHGRGAAVGDVLANILSRAGYAVTKEYYINDAGRQIRTLGRSTFLRWQELKGLQVSYEKDLYQGEYVKDLAGEIIDRGIEVPRREEDAITLMSRFSGDAIMNGIINDLEDFGVRFDSYYRESALYEKGVIDSTLSLLRDKGYAYENDGALWFRTSAFEKDEDRVLIKSDGEKTYFTSDIAYHLDKFERSYDTLVDIWGSDHHGYIPRLKAAIQALGKDKEDLKVILIQFVSLLKDGKPIGMSTRAGEFTTLREVLDEVGRDAARFFFLMRKSDAHLEFDLDLAVKTSNENPVYYVQYAHARIMSIFRNAAAEGIDAEQLKNADLRRLTQDDEIKLIKSIVHFHDVIEGCAKSFEPHRITFYLLDLVGNFHSYYNKTRVLVDDRELTIARLMLLQMLREVIRSGLDILGVSAPEKM